MFFKAFAWNIVHMRDDTHPILQAPIDDFALSAANLCKCSQRPPGTMVVATSGAPATCRGYCSGRVVRAPAA